MSKIFEDLRYKRNSLTYYGNKMEYEVGKESINKTNTLIKKLTNIFKEKISQI